VNGNVYATLVEFRNAKEAEKVFQDLDGAVTQVIYAFATKFNPTQIREHVYRHTEK
jgi:hypothetical protein